MLSQNWVLVRIVVNKNVSCKHHEIEALNRHKKGADAN